MKTKDQSNSISKADLSVAKKEFDLKWSVYD